MLEGLRKAVLNGEAPFNDIDAIKNKRNFKGRLFAFALYIGAAPQSKTVDGLTVTAVRPPMLDGLHVKT